MAWVRDGVAVVGVGAIGGVVAARLSAAGKNVVLCVRERFDELVIEGPEGIMKVTPRSVMSPEGVEPVPWVLLATKAHQTAGAAGWLRTLANTRTTVAILQNGVEHEERVRPYVNGASLLPAVVECRASRMAPGRVVQHTPAEIPLPFYGLALDGRLTSPPFRRRCDDSLSNLQNSTSWGSRSRRRSSLRAGHVIDEQTYGGCDETQRSDGEEPATSPDGDG